VTASARATPARCAGRTGARRPAPSAYNGPMRQRVDSPAALPVGTRRRVAVTGLAAEGDGVARIGELVAFVPGTAPGDVAEVEVTEAAPRYVRARVVRLETPGPGRAAPPCPVFGACGGCAWQHLAYPEQLRWKRAIVVEALRRLGHVADPEGLVREVLPADPPWRYRHKMAVPVTPGPRPGDPPRIGFYAHRSHRVVPFASCLIQHPLLDRVRAEAARLAHALGVPAYDERTRRGLLRHVVARVSHSRGELLVCLVTAQDAFPQGRAMAEGLMEALDACVGVVQNVQDGPGNAVLGPTTRPLRGRDHVVEELDGLTFLVSAPSFFQVSPVQAARLYQVAVRQAGLGPEQVALDLYAGVGTLTLFLARHARRVHAVEEVPAAVTDGRRNAARNGMAHVTFHTGPAEAVVPALVRQGLRPDVVVLDPPRKGAAPEVLEAAAAAGPRRIVYVSCNPATLARDVERLARLGYALQEVQPVDMFPQTAHVEASALLVRTDAPAAFRSG
jgi:23S rRNA (uracil1939-C5)-methyltransferase